MGCRWFIDVFCVVFSERQLKKKASVLFGIRFDDKKYSELKAHLDTIDENRDLVCDSSLEKDNWIKVQISN